MDSTIEPARLPDEPGVPAGWSLFVFLAVVAAISAVVLTYAVTRAFVWDEGYHLIAAQQIARGKLPYIDFCFPQTPLNAFLNAAILRMFGEYWQPVHFVAASFSLGAMALTAQYLLTYFPDRRWRLGCAAAAAIFIGFNETFVQFGSVGQAYGISLLFSVLAFRFALPAARSSKWLGAFACGLCAGIAADSTLLTGPIIPVFLLWLWLKHQAGSRLGKAAAYLVGVALAFAPVAWLYMIGPAQTLFNIVKYHAIYRRVAWPGATLHDAEVLTSWLSSTQVMMLVVLISAAIIFRRNAPVWQPREREGFQLAAWLTLALGLYICTPHPTFSRYFIFIAPFVAILATAGLYRLSARLQGDEGKAKWPSIVACLLMALMFGKGALQSYDDTTWQEYDEVLKKIIEVTPVGGRLFADEVVYFALQQNPPPGMEVSYTHSVQLPPAEEALYHLVTEPDLKKQLARGEFATFQSCSDPEIERLGLPGPFAHRVILGDCTIYWGPRR